MRVLDDEVRSRRRDVDANDADNFTEAWNVTAINIETVAAGNGYWHRHFPLTIRDTL